MKAIIFDLDQTLVDSKAAQAFRDKRDWQSVYKLIPALKVFEEIDDLLLWLKEQDVKIAIVTQSPRPYCERIIKHWGWAIDATVCYHDVAKRKPHPESIQKAITALGVEPANVISIGDSDIDIIASKDSGVYTIGVTWGALNLEALKRSEPDVILDEVKKVKAEIANRFNLKS